MSLNKTANRSSIGNVYIKVEVNLHFGNMSDFTKVLLTSSKRTFQQCYPRMITILRYLRFLLSVLCSYVFKSASTPSVTAIFFPTLDTNIPGL